MSSENIIKIIEILFGVILVLFGIFSLYHVSQINPLLGYNDYRFVIDLTPSHNFDLEDVIYSFDFDNERLNLSFLIIGNTTNIIEDRHILLRYPSDLSIMDYTIRNGDIILENNSGFWLDHFNGEGGLTVFEDLNFSEEETFVNIIFNDNIIPNGLFRFEYDARLVRSGDDTRVIFNLGETYSCKDNCIDRKVESEENIHYDKQEIIEVDTEDNIKYNAFRLNTYNQKSEFQITVWLGLGLGSIIPGVSLIILGLIPLILFIRNRKPLENIFGDCLKDDEECNIVIPTLKTNLTQIQKDNGSLIHWNPNWGLHSEHDSKALSFIYSLLKLGKDKPNLSILTDTQVSLDDFNNNYICIGAGSNDKTKKILKKFSLPFNFSETKEGDVVIFGEKIIGDNGTWDTSKGFDYGIITKINERNKTHFIFAGLGPEGTLGSAYYFSKNWRALSKEFKKSSFGILVRINVTEGYKSVKKVKSRKF